MRGNPLYTGVQGVRGLYIRPNLNRVRMILKCFYKGGKIRVVLSPFFVQFGAVLGTGVTGGVTKWGYIFRKVGLQKWVLRGYDTRGWRYYFSCDMCVLCCDRPTLNAPCFWKSTLLNSVISGTLSNFTSQKRGGEGVMGETGGLGGSSYSFFSFQRFPLITWKSSIRRSQRVKSGHWRQAFLFQ